MIQRPPRTRNTRIINIGEPFESFKFEPAPDPVERSEQTLLMNVPFPSSFQLRNMSYEEILEEAQRSPFPNLVPFHLIEKASIQESPNPFENQQIMRYKQMLRDDAGLDGNKIKYILRKKFDTLRGQKHGPFPLDWEKESRYFPSLEDVRFASYSTLFDEAKTNEYPSRIPEETLGATYAFISPDPEEDEWISSYHKKLLFNDRLTQSQRLRLMRAKFPTIDIQVLNASRAWQTKNKQLRNKQEADDRVEPSTKRQMTTHETQDAIADIDREIEYIDGIFWQNPDNSDLVERRQQLLDNRAELLKNFRVDTSLSQAMSRLWI